MLKVLLSNISLVQKGHYKNLRRYDKIKCRTNTDDEG